MKEVKDDCAARNETVDIVTMTKRVIELLSLKKQVNKMNAQSYMPHANIVHDSTNVVFGDASAASSLASLLRSTSSSATTINNFSQHATFNISNTSSNQISLIDIISLSSLFDVIMISLS